MKIWIASDCSCGRMLEIEDNGKTGKEIAEYYGRAEFGEIIHIWRDGNTDSKPDVALYWDSQYREYRYSRAKY